MARLLELFAGFDRKTAGWKTYAGLALVGLGLAGGTFGALTPEQAAAVQLAGLALAGAGKVLADVRPEAIK